MADFLMSDLNLGDNQAKLPPANTNSNEESITRPFKGDLTLDEPVKTTLVNTNKNMPIVEKKYLKKK